jgi:phage terminase large subunit
MGYTLPPKLEPFEKRPARYKVAYGGRGSGKSWGVARLLLDFGTRSRLRILCAREIMRTISESVHQLLRDQISELGLSSFYTVTDNAIRGANGTEFYFAGLRTQDAHKLKSYEGVDICWVEEAQVVSKRSWDILLPTIRKPLSEIWVTFNPELDTDETYQRFVANPPEQSVVVKMNYGDNPWFPEVLELERRTLLARDPEAHRNVWEGECRSAVEGAIYAKEVAALYESGRVRPCPYDPLLPVHTVWDLGWNDQTSIALVQRASEVRVIGYIEDSHRTLADYVAQLKLLPYVWGQDWLPHDGQARDYKSGKSAEEMLKAMQRDPRIVENLDIESGIKAARMVFPRVYIDPKAERLLHCLKRYRRTINQNTNEPGPPLHDEYSHGADCFRYLALCVDQMGNSRPMTDPYAGFARKYG